MKIMLLVPAVQHSLIAFLNALIHAGPVVFIGVVQHSLVVSLNVLSHACFVVSVLFAQGSYADFILA